MTLKSLQEKISHFVVVAVMPVKVKNNYLFG